MILWYIASAVVAKTSLLGFGMLSLGLCIAALVALRLFSSGLSEKLQQRFRQIFRTGLYLHLATYALLMLKLTLIEGWQDVPAFFLGHLVLHHAVSALIATILIIMTIRIYNHRSAGVL